ncbi:bactericidal permeability-increasing bpi protein-related [Anaeramoeba ignava]|uniref:Bactericidal permeability-increasing bpi protein-related n=1 Tax=Anaeramoeba ignava TaxID=1746090 RepID=A0A9Q0LQ63_ANAIG|nr:bactericidal permeability-increasing bpi protein-related [Anaeramoeba ignava]|eukprot:Anaeramoba_ignava/a612012_259.p1 GENE.a612012_259~~a612012_259.p1  ORF type:complete len:489 (+),score=119.88 a612012_259:23-1468(+)
MKTFCLLFLIALIFYTNVIHTEQTEPEIAMKAFVTMKGIEKIQSIINPILIQEIQNVQIPPVTVKKDGLTLELYNMVITKLQFDQETVTLTAPDEITIAIKQLSTHCDMDWHYTFGLLKDSGTADEEVTEVDITMTLKYFANNSHIALVAESAQCSIGKLDITLHGGASWLYNIIIDILKGPIKDLIASSLSSEFVTEINTLAPSLLDSIPIKIDIDQYTSLHFEMLGQELTSEYIAAFNNAEFYDIANPVECPLPHHDLPSTPKSEDYMAEVYLDEFAINSAFYAYNEEGRIDIIITNGEIPPYIPFQLNTSEFKDYIPNLYEKYPDLLMTIEITPNVLPSISITEANEIDATLILNLNFSVVESDNTTIPVFTFVCDIDADVDAYMDGETICGNLTLNTFTLVDTWTSIGPIDMNLFMPTLDMMVNAFVVPFLNGYLKTGFPIPTIDGVSFENSEVSYGDGYILISTDVDYTPPEYNFY